MNQYHDSKQCEYWLMTQLGRTTGQVSDHIAPLELSRSCARDQLIRTRCVLAVLGIGMKA